ncbi:glycosyltransferase [Hymenobacter actinosclerus]|uniref:Glycosyltransferase, catalytic subunit of cellulose synthase and poly-beta-1,6-N-acetylglucosamine synthase n=1 Tax=Hymenobacter actinosclerus TaxID=82805 RepID=A0A1I0BJM0_9BACT|nr:glycosyltransferase [Hymenobacter actinosclerus]SET07117.1 Glycosyltransferase, catalytic subunit of cellulose synthase and poly-beta-1,6-N-acetylglucosamine synthase [Hymenobacter actinosclerus]
MSNAWSLLLLAFPALYAGQMLRLRRAWQQLPVPELPPMPEPAAGAILPAAASSTPRFSVLVAARNEAANLPLLLADLAQQHLPAQEFEVIITDDHSTDDTAALLMAAAETTPFRLRVVKLAETPAAGVGKKAALQAALAHARAPWLVCTDADCRVGPDWLRAYAALLDAAGPEVHLVSGPVLLTGPDTLLQNLSGLEFAGLVGTGAAGIAAGTPTMCNGANLAYRRTAFEAVAGYAGNAHLPSGDDEFLLHKLHAAFPGSIRFLRHPAALVRTAGPPTLAALLRQRVRWASKWRHYQHPPSQRLAVLVLLANLAPAAGLVGAFWLPALLPWAAAGLGLKLAADGWFLDPVLRFLGRRRWLLLVPLLQLAYAPYALLVGLAGLRGGYEWKGRRAG